MNDGASCCPCCGHPLAPLTILDLREWCDARGHKVLPGDWVDTATAAATCGVQPQSLRANRGCIPYTRRGRRCFYRLADLVDVDRR